MRDKNSKKHRGDSPPNIVFLVADCLRQDIAYDKDVMPFLNKTFRYKVKEAYSNAPTTQFAVPAFMTGKIPFEVSSREGITENHADLYLPEILREEGYKNIFITGNVVTSAYFGYDRGIDFFEDFVDLKRAGTRKASITKWMVSLVPKRLREKKNILTRSTKKIFGRLQSKQNIDLKSNITYDKILRVLKKVDFGKRNFVFLHLMDTHTPYFSEKDRKKIDVKKLKRLTMKLYSEDDNLTKEDISFLKEAYLKQAKNIDKGISEIYEYLKNTLGPNTVFFVFSDHGEAFNETGYMEHPPEKVDNPQHIRTPLMSNRNLGRKVIFSNNIYEMVLGLVKESNFSEKRYCIGYSTRAKGLRSEYDIYAYFDYDNNRYCRRLKDEKELPKPLKKILGKKLEIDLTDIKF
ncbi:MAG: sulfatase-like hydrolase/transferase [Candidatus Woesearchaeota archaeon]